MDHASGTAISTDPYSHSALRMVPNLGFLEESKYPSKKPHFRPVFAHRVFSSPAFFSREKEFVPAPPARYLLILPLWFSQ